MRLATSVLAAAAAALLLPGAAHAKELKSARACDADGCRTVTGAALRGMDEGRPTDAPKQGAPFYRVHMRVDIPGAKDYRYTLAYVPSGGLLRVEGQFDRYDWLAATPQGRRAFERLTRGIEPVAAGKLRGVGVGENEPVADVDEVVAPPAPAPDGTGFPWAVLLIPAALVPAGAAWAARRRELPGPRKARRARA